MTGLARLTLPFPQIAAGLGLTTLIAAGLVWVQGQRMHSAKVERDAAVAQVKAYDKAWKARNDADANAVGREKDYDASKNAVGVPDDPRIYLCRLRAVQTSTDPTTCR